VIDYGILGTGYWGAGRYQLKSNLHIKS